MIEPRSFTSPVHILTVDPPWSFGDKLPGPGRGAEKHYSVMSLDQIKAFPLPPLADDCLLFLWRVASQLPEALDVLRAWGFTAKAEMVWVKTKKGTPDDETEAQLEDETSKKIGMGHYVRNEHEAVIVATYKANGKVADKGVRSTFRAPIGEHSEKPEKFYQLVERLAGPGKVMVELFGRKPRVGWHVYGDELPNGYAWTPREDETILPVTYDVPGVGSMTAKEIVEAHNAGTINLNGSGPRMIARLEGDHVTMVPNTPPMALGIVNANTGRTVSCAACNRGEPYVRGKEYLHMCRTDRAPEPITYIIPPRTMIYQLPIPEGPTSLDAIAKLIADAGKEVPRNLASMFVTMAEPWSLAIAYSDREERGEPIVEPPLPLPPSRARRSDLPASPFPATASPAPTPTAAPPAPTTFTVWTPLAPPEKKRGRKSAAAKEIEDRIAGHEADLARLFSPDELPSQTAKARTPEALAKLAGAPLATHPRTLLEINSHLEFAACGDCGLPQYETASGRTCAGGHGDAPSVTSTTPNSPPLGPLPVAAPPPATPPSGHPEATGALPTHVVTDLGEHPALTEEERRKAFIDRARREGLLADADLAEGGHAAWIKLQYRAPAGWFKAEAAEAENLSALAAALSKHEITTVTLPMLASWPVAERQAIRQWVARGAYSFEIPIFLHERLIENGEPGYATKGTKTNGWERATAMLRAWEAAGSPSP